MKSSEVLRLSHPILANYSSFSDGQPLPNFIKEIAEFGKCIYYIERYCDESELIFETQNITRWENAREKMQYVIDILLENNRAGRRIKFSFVEKSDRELEESVKNQSEFASDYYANVLYSGGADSICGAHYHVNNYGRKIIFTHIFHKNTPSITSIRSFIQQDLRMPLVEIDAQFTNEAKFRTVAGIDSPSLMNLNQTRTLLYLSHAVSVNYSKGIRNLQITENGPFTINPAFTDDILFTNTTNPEFVDFFNQFLEMYLGQDLIHISIPFKEYTKAELMASVPDTLLIRTHSCSRTPSQRRSCFNCYACFYRRFSSYAYRNFRDDNYDDSGTQRARYEDDNEKNLFNKSIPFFARSDGSDARFIINLIEFCSRILKRNHDTGFIRKYSMVVQKIRRLDGSYYNNQAWDLLERYANDMLAGINNYFERNPHLRNNQYYVWTFFTDSINRLIENNILQRNFAQITEQRIRLRAESIRGESQ